MAATSRGRTPYLGAHSFLCLNFTCTSAMPLVRNQCERAVVCSTYRFENSRLPNSLDGEPAPVLLAPATAPSPGPLPKGYLKPAPGASIGEFAVVELADLV